MTIAFPLQWPDNFPRSTRRESGSFKTDYKTAVLNVAKSLQLFAENSGKTVESPVMSSNIDPNPLAPKVAKPRDPGIAVWFTWDEMQVCIAVDRYDTPAANLQAIHHIIEARRTELRHGTLHLVRATFQGFRALPAPHQRPWWAVLDVPRDATKERIEKAYREKAKTAHPDAGGSARAMTDLNHARTVALAGLE